MKTYAEENPWNTNLEKGGVQIIRIIRVTIATFLKQLWVSFWMRTNVDCSLFRNKDVTACQFRHRTWEDNQSERKENGESESPRNITLGTVKLTYVQFSKT
jgi:hypothetical protein